MTLPRPDVPSLPRRSIALALLLGALLAIALTVPTRASAAPPEGYFGIAEPTIRPGDLTGMRRAGAGALRIEFSLGHAKWKRGQPYDWSYFDHLVEGAAGNGLDIVPMLYGTPPWQGSKRGKTPMKSKSALREWDAFLEALVRRYGPVEFGNPDRGTFWLEHTFFQADPYNPYETRTPYRPITAWQIWNEPNSITWWRPKPSPKQYAALLRRSANVLHGVDPSAQVMTAGIVANPTNSHAIPAKKFVPAMLRTRGTPAAMDILAFHPYAQTAKDALKQMKRMRGTLRKGGDPTAPIWITEIGWGSRGPKGAPLVQKPAQQQRSLTKLMNGALALRDRYGIERLFWYHWRDGPDSLCKWCKTSGLVDKHSQPKELLYRYESVAKGIPRDQLRSRDR
jgi:hypothetical protein